MKVSVVIPSRRRETRLAFALDALAAQTLPAHEFEVIVVRPEADSGDPLTRPPRGMNVRYLTSMRAGTAAQRNVGWRMATAPLVAFTDDDCRASADWLEALVAAANSDAIVQGRTEPDPDEIHHLHGLARTIRVERSPAWYETCNIAYPRRLLERLGGFDESFDFLGEDADLGCRAQASGADLEFVDSAIVWHAVHRRSVADALRDAWKRRTLPELVRRQPGLRSRFWYGFVSDLDHARLIVAFAGVALWPRSRLAATACAVPYLRRRVDPSRLRHPWGAARMPFQLGGRILVDGVEVAVFVAGSIRSRTLVI